MARCNCTNTACGHGNHQCAAQARRDGQCQECAENNKYTKSKSVPGPKPPPEPIPWLKTRSN